MIGVKTQVLNLLGTIGNGIARTWESWAQSRRDEKEHRRAVERDHGYPPITITKTYYGHPPRGIALVMATLLVCATLIVVVVIFGLAMLDPAAWLETYKEFRTLDQP